MIYNICGWPHAPPLATPHTVTRCRNTVKPGGPSRSSCRTVRAPSTSGATRAHRPAAAPPPPPPPPLLLPQLPRPRGATAAPKRAAARAPRVAGSPTAAARRSSAGAPPAAAPCRCKRAKAAGLSGHCQLFVSCQAVSCQSERVSISL